MLRTVRRMIGVDVENTFIIFASLNRVNESIEIIEKYFSYVTRTPISKLSFSYNQKRTTIRGRTIYETHISVDGWFNEIIPMEEMNTRLTNAYLKLEQNNKNE